MDEGGYKDHMRRTYPALSRGQIHNKWEEHEHVSLISGKEEFEVVLVRITLKKREE